jgi:hypothetical protein
MGWLLADCERCFLREVAHGVRRPGRPPEIFNVADAAMKRRFEGGPEVVHDLGVGRKFTVVAQGLHVESIPYEDPAGVSIVLKGRLDALVQTIDGDVIVLDYKTMMRSDVESGKRAYSAQLESYALALRYPKLVQQQTRVDGLALLVFHPSDFAYRTAKKIAGLYGLTDWVDVPSNEEDFRNVLNRAARLLVGDLQPTPNTKCNYCSYYGAVPLPLAAASTLGVL